MTEKKILVAVLSAGAAAGIILVIAISMDLSHLDGSAFRFGWALLWVPVFIVTLGVIGCLVKIVSLLKSK